MGARSGIVMDTLHKNALKQPFPGKSSCSKVVIWDGIWDHMGQFPRGFNQFGNTHVASHFVTQVSMNWPFLLDCEFF